MCGRNQSPTPFREECERRMGHPGCQRWISTRRTRAPKMPPANGSKVPGTIQCTPADDHGEQTLNQRGHGGNTGKTGTGSGFTID
jgi:hypothetical protein